MQTKCNQNSSYSCVYFEEMFVLRFDFWLATLFIFVNIKLCLLYVKQTICFIFFKAFRFFPANTPKSLSQLFKISKFFTKISFDSNYLHSPFFYVFWRDFWWLFMTLLFLNIKRFPWLQKFIASCCLFSERQKMERMRNAS